MLTDWFEQVRLARMLAKCDEMIEKGYSKWTSTKIGLLSLACKAKEDWYMVIQFYCEEGYELDTLKSLVEIVVVTTTVRHDDKNSLGTNIAKCLLLMCDREFNIARFVDKATTRVTFACKHESKDATLYPTQIRETRRGEVFTNIYHGLCLYFIKFVEEFKTVDLDRILMTTFYEPRVEVPKWTGE